MDPVFMDHGQTLHGDWELRVHVVLRVLGDLVDQSQLFSKCG